MSNYQIAIDGYVIQRKNRAATQNKSGGGLVLYCRNSLTCSRLSELETLSLVILTYYFGNYIGRN